MNLFLLILSSIISFVFFTIFVLNYSIIKKIKFKTKQQKWKNFNIEKINKNELSSFIIKNNPIQLIGTYFEGKNILIGHKDVGHSLIVGGSGSGKTEKYFKSNIIFNSLLANKPHMLIVDLKGDESSLNNEGVYGSLLQELGGFLESKNYKIFSINFLSDKKNLIYTNQFNILEIIFLNRKNKYKIDVYIDDFLQQLFPLKKDKDSYWIYSSRIILKSILEYMIDLNLLKKYFNMNTVIEIWEMFPNYITSFKKNQEDSNSKIDPLILNLISKNIDFIESRSFSEIRSTIASELKKFSDFYIKTIINSNGLSLEKFFSTPSILFFQTSGNNENHNMIIALIFKQFIDYKIENYDGNYFLMFLDEFNNFSQITNFSNYLDTTRSKNIFFHIGLQSINKFEEKYGDIQIYANNFQYSYLIGSTTNNKELSYFNPYVDALESKSFSYSNDGTLNNTTKSKSEGKRIPDIDLMINKDNVFLKIRDQDLKEVYFDWTSKIHDVFYKDFSTKFKPKKNNETYKKLILDNQLKFKNKLISKLINTLEKDSSFDVEALEDIRYLLESIPYDDEWKENLYWKLVNLNFNNDELYSKFKSIIKGE